MVFILENVLQLTDTPLLVYKSLNCRYVVRATNKAILAN